MKVYTSSGRESALIVPIRKVTENKRKKHKTYSPDERFNRFRLNERTELGIVTNEHHMPETYYYVYICNCVGVQKTSYMVRNDGVTILSLCLFELNSYWSHSNAR